MGILLLGCIVLAAEDVQRDVRLVADDPAVVTRRYVEEIALAHHHLASVVHLGDRLSVQDEPDVLDLARTLAGRRADVLGPSPARLIRRAPERRRTDRIELEATLFE